MNKPKLGVGIFIQKSGKVLLGKRIQKQGENQWSFPGGHVEFLETAEEGIIREVREEVNIEVKNLEFLTYTDDFYKKEQLHYITLVFVAEYESGDLRLMEPDRFEEWKWFDMDDLPKPFAGPLTGSIQSFIAKIKK